MYAINRRDINNGQNHNCIEQNGCQAKQARKPIGQKEQHGDANHAGEKASGKI